MRAKQAGFTLVEIAIVLVIIGLLLGGVLKGQELVTQARIKNIVGDFNGVTAAVYGYQDRYKALPGDDSKAGTRWTSPAADVGDGDGLIEDAKTGATNKETENFWHHLRLAGLITGDTSATEGFKPPLNAVSGQITVNDSKATGAPLIMVGIVICSTNLSGKIAEAVDSQTDDGKPDTGSVLAIESSDLTKKATSYKDTGSLQYIVCRAI
jgi:prepilin-type N-terminal cleavage/methylation domain-containing protein